ncbi:MAG: hypothetical protein KDA21_08745, partial [Phycisphaerales bacterium]|nr:hypothetical protein [Phycisphaerales bacterium]
MRRAGWSWLLLLLTLLAPLALPAPARSQQIDNRPDCRVDFGFNGMMVGGHWNPMRIYVIGSTQPVSGDLIITLGVHSRVTGRVSVPYVATPNATFPFDVAIAPVSSTWFGNDGRWVSVTMTDRSGRSIRKYTWNTSPRGGQLGLTPPPLTDTSLLIVSTGSSSLRSIRNAWGSSTQADDVNWNSQEVDRWQFSAVAEVEPASLPTISMTWDGASLAVIQGRDIDAVPVDARRALLEWVERGGRLFLVLGDAAPDLSRWLPDDVFETDVTPADPETARPAVRRFDITPLGKRLGWTAEDPLDAGAPGWVATGPRGLGIIRVAAGDPRDVIADSETLVLSWQQLLEPMLADTAPPAYASWFAQGHAVTARRQALDTLAESLASAEPFPFLFVVIFALCFTLVLSLIDYLLIRRTRLGWRGIFTAFVWLTLFAAIGYAVPLLTRSGESQWRRLSLVDIAPDFGVAWEEGVTGVYSAHTQRIGFDGADGWWTSVDPVNWSPTWEGTAITAHQP